MRRKPFLIFWLVVGVLIAGVTGFIQSAQFATFLKRGLVKYLPRDLGVQADFTELAIGIFPPSLSLKNPLITVSDRGSADLPVGARIRAERLELRFLPFQIFAGDVRVSRLAVVNGEVYLPVAGGPAAPKPKSSGKGLSWSDLFQLRIDAFALENTRLQFELADPGLSVALLAESASIGQAEVSGGPGYELSLKVRDVDARLPKLWARSSGVSELKLDRIDGLATVSAKEFRLIGLDVEGLGSRVKTSLAIPGDILRTAALPVSGDLEFEGSLPEIVGRLWPSFDPKGELAGKLRFGGRVEARMDRLVETLAATGRFNVSEFRFRHWRADRVEAEGSLDRDSSGNPVIKVSRARAEAAPRERVGANQPGSGGKLDIADFEWKPDATEPLSVAIKLENAHLHWLAAVATKAVYPLDFRISGEVKARFQPPTKTTDWSLDAELNLAIPKFQLDNQKLGVPRPLRPVLKIPQVVLQGGAHFDSNQFRPDNLIVSAGTKTKLGVTGKIGFKTGYDLTGAGPIDFSEFESLADTPIRGDGSVVLHVHGPTERVLLDFDTQLKSAEYLGLRLGNLHGRITYDDGPSRLLFTDVDLTKGRTALKVDGTLDLGDVEGVNLDVRVAKGRFEELSDVFARLTDPISWYPKSLVGDVSGSVKVGGKPEFALLEIRADLNGADWDYWGERFRDVKLKGGYIRGKYLIESFTARKQDARVNGAISYDSNPGAGERMDWELATSGLQIQSFDRVLRLDVPMRGNLEIRSSGRGKTGAVESETRIALTKLTVRGQPYPDSDLDARTGGGKLTVRGRGFGEQGDLTVDYDWHPGAPSRFKLGLNGFDFSPFLVLFNTRLGQDSGLNGRITGKLDLAFSSGSMELASGMAELNEYRLGKSGTQWSLVSPASAKLSGGSFDPVRVAIRGGGQQSELKIRGNSGSIDGSVSGAWSASILEFVTSTIEQASGPILVDGRITGPWKSPTVSGSAQLNSISLRTSFLESPFESLEGTLRLSQNIVTLDRVQGDLANGRFSAGGNVTLLTDRVPELALTAQVNSSRIKIYPFQFVKVRGKFAVKGKELPYLIEGSAVADSGLIREKIMGTNSVTALRTAKYTPPPARRDYVDLPKFKLDVEFKSDRGILVQNDLFDAELKAQMRLVNTIDNPRPLGTAELIQGKLLFKDRVFAIQSGSARFDSAVAINPAFNLAASTEVSNTKIQLFANGRMDDYKIDLTSNPAMPEAEILSLLATGVSGDEARRLRAATGTFEQGEAASLLLHSLDFNRDVQDKTGFQIQIGEASGQQSAASVTRPRSESETASSPKIVIRRNIGKNVAVSVGSTVGVGNTSRQEVNLEYRVTPGMSINGVWDATDAGASSARSSNPYTYGLDLKLEKRFK